MAAIPFLNNVDLTGNELQNFKAHRLASDPSVSGSAYGGLLWYNTTNNLLKFWDGAQIATVVTNVAGTAHNAGLFDNQLPSYYLDRANHTGSLVAADIADFDTQVRTSRLDQMASPVLDIEFNSVRLKNVASPLADFDAATKEYVDQIATGLDIKASVLVATPDAASISGGTYDMSGGALSVGQWTGMPDELDGIALSDNDRVLVKDHTNGNGIWVVTSVGTGSDGVWDRAEDADADAKLTGGAFTFVEKGDVNAASGWVLSDPPANVGSSPMVWTQFTGGAAYTAGDGLDLTGSVLSAVGTPDRISVGPSGIDIAATYVGQTSITTLGTIGTGTWEGTPVDLAHGGTGATDAAGARAAISATGAYSADIGDGTSTVLTVTHNLGTKDVVTSVRDKTTDAVVYCTVINATTNTVTLGFASAPAVDAYRATVVG